MPKTPIGSPPWTATSPQGRPIRLCRVATLVRYGPVLVVVAYVAAVGGNWWLILLVGGFAASAFWMLDGLLGHTERIGGLDAMRRIREERDRERRRPPGAN